MENNLLKYIVYCTTCLVNNKIYIGVHKTNLEFFDGYLGNGVYLNQPSTYEKSQTKFKHAVKKYGPNQFKRSTIAIFDSEEEAYNLEAKIVTSEFLERPDVYNMCLGGKLGLPEMQSEKIYQYNSEGIFIKEYSSMKEAALSINRNFKTFWNAVENKLKCSDYFWTKVKYDKLDLSKMHNYEDTRKCPVFQYDNLGNYECCYESINDTARILNIHSGNLVYAIKLGTICKNKYFTLNYAPNFSISKDKQLKSFPIYQYDLEGNFIAEYSNMQEAKNKLNIKSNIYSAIKLGRTAGNFQWSFEKLNKMPKVQSKSGKARKVGKYDKEWNLIKEYPTLQECKKENGSGMIHVLQGRDQFAKGFRYKYIE